MCGLVGIYSFKRNILDRKEYIQKCLLTMKHRGPDSHAIWHNNANFISGFVRLSIRDISNHGNQPMLSNCGNFCLSFNGEIYNSEKYKALLIREGVQFTSSSDTEVLLYALKSWGIQFVLEHFDGMFAFAFYDLQKNELLLARDRLGIKPLYIGFDKNESIIFSSQYDHIINYASIQHEAFDPSAIGTYLQLGYIPDNAGAINKTILFPHGHYAVINSSGYTITQYYSSVKSVHPQQGLSEALIQNAAIEQLVSDVEVGVFLSGGVDSSLLAYLVNNKQPISAFTVGTNDAYSDETNDATGFAKRIQMNHQVAKVTEQDFIETLEDNTEAYSEPFADFSSIPSLVISKFASAHVKVILSGDGPDELSYGYYRNIKLLHAGKYFFDNDLSKIAKLISGRFTSKYPFLDSRILTKKDFYSYYYQYLFLFGSSWVPAIFKPACAEAYFLQNIRNNSMQDVTLQNYMHTVRDIELNLHLQRVLLKLDRASMFHSIEARVPYLSNNVVDAAMAAGIQQHINGHEGKYFFKELLAQKTGHDYAYKQKKGFLVPMAAWLRNQIKTDVYDKILNMPADLDSMFNRNQLIKLLDKHTKDGKDFSGIIWSLYALVNWYNKHYNKQILRS